MFSKYHYLSASGPPGLSKVFGLFKGDDQIGFIAYSNYVPHGDRRRRMKMHANRLVVHPDYVGIGLGRFLLNETAAIVERMGFDVFIKLSSAPVVSMLKTMKSWVCVSNDVECVKRLSGNMKKETGFRLKVRTYSFRFVGDKVTK